MGVSLRYFLVFAVISLTKLLNTAAAGPLSDSLSMKIRLIDPKKVQLKEVGKLPKILKEASGLEITRDGHLWSHNDDGIPALYCLDTLGNLVRAIQLNCVNRGWEDLTLDEEGNMFIGGFGNNKNDKTDLKIYKIPDPGSITQMPALPEIIHYTYEDQKTFPPSPANKNFDVDAFFAWQGSLYLFTKNRSTPSRGYSKIYRLPAQPGKQTAVLIDSIFVGNGPMIHNWITGADISQDGKTIALLFHDRIWFLRGFSTQKFSKATVYQLDLNNYSHKAGISFMNHDRIYIVDELELDLIGGKLYTLDFRKVAKEFTN
jgi:hypothetical protein